MTVNRVSWRDYYLGIADAVAVRADCTRRHVGAIVVKNNSIISTGYNGAPPGEPGCLSDKACPRGRHYKNMNYGTLDYGYHCGGCGPKVPWPCVVSVKPGSSYDTGMGACIALHAEQNALIRAGDRAQGATLYCTDEPCDACMRLIRGAGIDTAVWYTGRWDRPKTERSLILKAWRWMQALGRSAKL
jgi:dCMP deaminase